jgi:hypothetical protein
MKRITFKSTPKNWFKEAKNIKRNTVRIFNTIDDVREKILESFIKEPFDLLIEITNTQNGDSTIKDVIDVTMIECECHKRIYIISW